MIRSAGLPAVLANVPNLESILGANPVSDVYKLELDATEIKALIADLAAIARRGDAEAGNLAVELGESIQGECLEMSCGDPVEAEIASAVAGGMADSGVNQWEAENIGRNVASAIKAYRREMAKADDDE